MNRFNVLPWWAKVRTVLAVCVSLPRRFKSVVSTCRPVCCWYSSTKKSGTLMDWRLGRGRRFKPNMFNKLPSNLSAPSPETKIKMETFKSNGRTSDRPTKSERTQQVWMIANFCCYRSVSSTVAQLSLTVRCVVDARRKRRRRRRRRRRRPLLGRRDTRGRKTPRSTGST